MAGRNMCIRRTNPAARCRSRRDGRVCCVSFTQGLGRPDQSVVYYTADRLYANVPFPDDATDIVYDRRRPYLSCITAATVDASMRFLPQRNCCEAGWSPLSAAGYRGALAERQTRDHRERRARLLQPRHQRRRPRASADHADAAAPRRRQDRASKSRSRRSRCRRTSSWPGTRSACRYRIIPRASAAPAVRTRSAARSRARSPPTCPWCSHSIAANSRRRTGRKRPAAPSSPTTTSRSIFLPRIRTQQLRLEPQIRSHLRQSRHPGEGSTRWRRAPRQRRKPTRSSSGMRKATAKQIDGRRRGKTGRAGGQPVGCAVARAGRYDQAGALPEGAENVEVRRRRGQAGIQFRLKREGAGDVLPRIA